MTTANETAEVVRQEEAFRGYFKVNRYFFRHGLFQGGVSEVLNREVFERGQSGAVLPYDPVRDEVLLIRQFRPGAYVAGRHPFMWEIPAGIIEANENAELLAVREVEEEAGLKVDRVEALYTLMLSPGCMSETCSVFVGRCDTSRAGGIFGHDSEGENILAKVFPLSEALAMAARNDIENVIAVVALQWLALNRDQLRKRWA
jgi:ADP-ribose pyrophosphatase